VLRERRPDVAELDEDEIVGLIPAHLRFDLHDPGV
jgi:hypothetical protein